MRSNRLSKHFYYWFFIWAIISLNSWAKTEQGLIISDLDTIGSGAWDGGWDFVKRDTCHNISGATCYVHFDWEWGPNGGLSKQKYLISGPERYYVFGKVNFDSVKSIPYMPNDTMLTNGWAVWGTNCIVMIPPDSLSNYIGMVWAFWTQGDPRFGYTPFSAKIKILDFIIRDSAQHLVDMVFLHTYNDNSYQDLRTSGLDTFHLDSVPTISQNPMLSSSKTRFKSSTTSAILIMGNSDKTFFLKSGFKTAEIYSITGRFLGKVALGENGVAEIERFCKGEKAVVVKVNTN